MYSYITLHCTTVNYAIKARDIVPRYKLPWMPEEVVQTLLLFFAVFLCGKGRGSGSAMIGGLRVNRKSQVQSRG